MYSSKYKYNYKNILNTERGDEVAKKMLKYYLKCVKCEQLVRKIRFLERV